MTVRVDWNAGYGHAWTGAQDGKVLLFAAGRDLTLTPDEAERLAAELLDSARKARVPK